jgi:hypothetical protein
LFPHVSAHGFHGFSASLSAHSSFSICTENTSKQAASSQALEARLCPQFIALILLSRARMVAKQKPTLKRLGIREIIGKMESIAEVNTRPYTAASSQKRIRSA